MIRRLMSTDCLLLVSRLGNEEAMDFDLAILVSN